MQSYEQWVSAAQQGDRAAFDRLIEHFGDAARRWAFARLGDEQAAEDAAQEAFLTAYRKLGDLRAPAAFPAWLKRVVLTECSRITRRKSPEVTAVDEDAPADADHDPARQIEERERRDHLWRAVDQLPEHERAVTELFYVYGYSLDEIADGLALPLTTVKKRLQYAREHIRENMPAMQLGAARFPAYVSPSPDVQIVHMLGMYRRYQLVSA
ncbi:MAG: sigma-70 family RNA polymerase sigma factor [Anaerolinea sp.]|nr:sigma-70 family RNA polymerase sigma factor [Anaerolinea sp.]